MKCQKQVVDHILKSPPQLILILLLLLLPKPALLFAKIMSEYLKVLHLFTKELLQVTLSFYLCHDLMLFMTSILKSQSHTFDIFVSKLHFLISNL